MIENAPLGVRAGVTAGCFTIAINSGPLEDKILLQEGANMLYPTIQELADNWDILIRGRE